MGASAVLVLFLLGSFYSPASASRGEELFLWKVADELKLEPKEEKRVRDLLKELSALKAGLVAESERLLATMKSEKDKRKFSTHIGRYRELQQKIAEISLKEVDGMKKLLGPERTAQYFVLKQELAQKVKTLITEKAEKAGLQVQKDLPPPRVIEE
ncbi:MAG: hypothetical protein N2578_07055 [Bdellovibrionaceae bacterium]|nr:hypothetical protein [Pseudobdellovibrionaceae bacterium]